MEVVNLESGVFGETLFLLRRKSGMTQQELAEKIGFSNKTVSQWENSETLPEITVLPRLAEIFGVSVDYLLLGERKSIAFVGDIHVDKLNEVDMIPESKMLAHITECTQSVGGCAPCTAINLAKIDPSIPISVWGCTGDDEGGRYVSAVMRQYNINTSYLTVLSSTHTGFCDVMHQKQGDNVFFYSKGANSLFMPEHVNVNQLQCNILHAGYLLMLDRFEEPDAEYGSKMARFLHSVQKKGIKTSVDIAKKRIADKSKDVISVLKYVDYLICNESECCNCFNLTPRNEDGTLNLFNVKTAMRKAISSGVKEKVIVHCKEACFLLNNKGEFVSVASLDVPEDRIKSTTGAGDAFCAGCLYGINNNFSDREILEFASCAGACNLFSENSIDGMKNKEYLFQMMREIPRKGEYI